MSEFRSLSASFASCLATFWSVAENEESAVPAGGALAGQAIAIA